MSDYTDLSMQVNELADSLSRLFELGKSLHCFEARRPSKKKVSFGECIKVCRVLSREEIISSAENELWWREEDYLFFRFRERTIREEKRAAQAYQQLQKAQASGSRVSGSPPPGFPPKTQASPFSFFSNVLIFSDQLPDQQHFAGLEESDRMSQKSGGYASFINFGFPPLVPNSGIFVQSAA
ncbi:unnamed protein product [Heterosigma akashiwo]